MTPARTDTPSDPAALEAAAARCISSGDVRGAISLLEQAVSRSPPSAPLNLQLAAVRRRAGDVDGALAAAGQALAASPRDFTALLMRASLLERKGDTREAAIAYGVALVQAPESLDVLNPATRKAVLHAREVHAGHQAELSAALRTTADSALATASPSQARRIGRFMEELSGRRRRYTQEPSAFFYSELAAIGFYDREPFPWLPALEAATDVIAAELESLIAADTPGFVPYVDYDDSLPLDQWKALNRSPDWSAFHLLFNGAPVEANCARCPRTMETLARLPQPRLPGRSPAAMFSVLRPHTRIPPHSGVSNTRLVVHLPLIVPPDCRFRVGDETRSWRRGEAWVFDDTMEHEACNDSDRDRVILIFDIEQPAISPAEHAAIAALTTTLDRFGAAPILSGL